MAKHNSSFSVQNFVRYSEKLDRYFEWAIKKYFEKKTLKFADGIETNLGRFHHQLFKNVKTYDVLDADIWEPYQIYFDINKRITGITFIVSNTIDEYKIYCNLAILSDSSVKCTSTIAIKSKELFWKQDRYVEITSEKYAISLFEAAGYEREKIKQNTFTNIVDTIVDSILPQISKSVLDKYREKDLEEKYFSPDKGPESLFKYIQLVFSKPSILKEGISSRIAFTNSRMVNVEKLVRIKVSKHSIDPKIEEIYLSNSNDGGLFISDNSFTTYSNEQLCSLNNCAPEVSNIYKYVDEYFKNLLSTLSDEVADFEAKVAKQKAENELLEKQKAEKTSVEQKEEVDAVEPVLEPIQEEIKPAEIEEEVVEESVPEIVKEYPLTEIGKEYIDSINITLDDDEALDRCQDLYDSLSDDEKNNEEVKSAKSLFDEFYDAYIFSDDDLENESSTKEDSDFHNTIKSSGSSIRSVYLSGTFSEKFDEIKDNPFLADTAEAIEEILIETGSLKYEDLCNYFRNKKINKTKGFKKIRIDKVKRIIFLWGNDFHDSSMESKGLYFIDIIMDHDFSNLKLSNYSKETYKFHSTNGVEVYAPTKEQIKYISSNEVPFQCFGVAGSGKTTVSIYKYLEIIKNYYGDSIITKNDIVHLTFNERVKDNNAKQMIGMGIPYVNCLTLDEFFVSLINEVSPTQISLDSVKGFDYFNDWLKGEYLKDTKKGTRTKYINALNQKKERANFVYVYYRGVYKGSMMNWIRDNVEKPLTKEQFSNNWAFTKKDNALTKEDIDVLYDVFTAYDRHLKENKLYDDNDLASLAIKYLEYTDDRIEHIIIDEVQDLTELQLAAVLKYSSNNYNLYFFGDQNQAINPTIFKVNAISGALQKLTHNNAVTVKNNKIDALNKTFRSGQFLVEYLNKLIKFRHIHCGKISEEYDQYIKPYNGLKVKNDEKYGVKYISNSEFIEHILQIVSDDPNTLFLVHSEQEKKNLRKKVGNKVDIYTIFEAKGLERKVVILYNFLSKNRGCYRDMIDNPSNRSYLNNMIFNRFFVGCSRATKALFIVEENLEQKIEDALINDFKVQHVILQEEIDSMIKPVTDPQVWYRQAKRAFENGLLNSATFLFKKALGLDPNNQSIKESLEICESLEIFYQDKRLKVSDKLANKLFERQYYNYADDVYTAAKNKVMSFKCKILSGNKTVTIDQIQDMLPLIEAGDPIYKEIIDGGYLNKLIKDIYSNYKKFKGEN